MIKYAGGSKTATFMKFVTAVFVIALILVYGAFVLPDIAAGRASAAGTDTQYAHLTYAEQTDTDTGERYYTVTGLDVDWADANIEESEQENVHISIPAEYEGLPVREIAKSAFEHDWFSECYGDMFDPTPYKITGVDFSGASNLKAIEDWAFAFSTLTTLSFAGASALEKIGKSAFSTAVYMEDVSFIGADSLSIIEETAFFACNTLEAVDFGGIASLETIVKSAFLSCPIKKLDLSRLSSLKEIGASAFSDSALEYADLTAPNLKKIGDCAFYSSELGTVKMGFVEEIGEEVFDSSELSLLIILDGAQTYAAYTDESHILSAKTEAMTYEFAVSFYGHKDKLLDRRLQLYGKSLAYTKDESTGLWSKAGEYTLPNASARRKEFLHFAGTDGGVLDGNARFESYAAVYMDIPLAPWEITVIVLAATLPLFAVAAVLLIRLRKNKLALRKALTASEAGIREPLPEILTEREREVAECIAKGKRQQDIASELFVSLSTVKKHTTVIYRKTNCRTRSEFIARFGK